jgi:hypothetical protein
MISRRSLVTAIAATATTSARPAYRRCGGLAGYMEGLRHCVDHRDEAINLSAEINDERPSLRYAFAYDEIVNGRMVSLNMEVPRDKIAWMQDTMIRVKQQEKPVDIDRLIDTRLHDQAQLVGRR